MSEDLAGENPKKENVARLLAEVVRDLSRISQVLAAQVREDSPEAESLRATREALADLARKLENEAAGSETVSSADREAARLRRAILENLHRRGPALFPELAAATLSLPDEIRPVLRAMEQEGLVEIQTLRGWEMVSLTARGRSAARRT